MPSLSELAKKAGVALAPVAPTIPTVPTTTQVTTSTSAMPTIPQVTTTTPPAPVVAPTIPQPTKPTMSLSQMAQKAGVELVKPPEPKGVFGRASDFVKKDVFGGGVKQDTNLAGDIFRSTVGSRGLAGVAQMPGKVIAQSGMLKEQTALNESQQKLAEITTQTIKKARETTDPLKKKRLLDIARSNMASLGAGEDAIKELEAEVLTPKETLSTAANAALTAATGSGGALTGATRAGVGRLSVGTLQKLPRLLPAVEKVLTVGKGVVPRAIEQGAINAGFAASENVRTGRPVDENLGVAAGVGAALPFAGTATSKVLSKVPVAKGRLAQRTIDSLIKPLLKDLSYGKNPGKRVAQEGLVFNTLEEGASVIGQRLNEIGNEMAVIAKNPRFEGKVYDFSDTITALDSKIDELGKNPRTNAEVIRRLQDAKDDLLKKADLGNGTFAYTRDLKNLTFDQAQQFKKDIGELTKFTGNASDDKAYNAALKASYGRTKDKINKIAPEMRELNERWADLKSAENAIKYRDKIESRQNLISFPSRTVAGLLTGTGIVTMNPALLVAAVSEVGLDKLLSSSAFKTRFARWLAKSAPEERVGLLRDAPVIKPILDRIFGKNKELSESQIKELMNQWNGKAGLTIEDVSKLTPEERVARGFEPPVAGQTTNRTNLVDEAKKYKSADEFVKEHGTLVYRGGAGLLKEKMTDAGVSVSKGKNVANDFVKQKGGTVREYVISSKAKIVDYADVPNVKFKNLNDYSPELDIGNKQIWRDLEVEYQKAIDWAKSNGYDGVRLPLEGETRIINTDVLKTKSQLTDIWNKANKKSAIPLKASKSKSGITFERAKDLSPEDVDIETKAFNKIYKDEEKIVDQYMKENGKIVNTDDFRPYFKDEGYAGHNAAAVQEPSSYLAKRVRERLLKNPEEFVTVYAGGSGTGKTSAVKSIDSLKTTLANSAAIIDGNLSSISSAEKIIAQAEKAGKQPIFVYTYREPLESLEKGVVKRMLTNKKEMGRLVPTKVVAENHIDSWKVIQEMKNRGYRIIYIDNSLGAGKAAISSFEELSKKIKYPSREELTKQFNLKAKELYDLGKRTDFKEGITKEQYEGYIK